MWDMWDRGLGAYYQVQLQQTQYNKYMDGGVRVVLIFLNKAPIVWYSKWQNMVESSTFKSKIVAMHIATDLIIFLHYKLRMFGVLLTGPANVFCDNQGVVNNMTMPESILSKKHNQICYQEFVKLLQLALSGLQRKTQRQIWQIFSLSLRICPGESFCYRGFCTELMSTSFVPALLHEVWGLINSWAICGIKTVTSRFLAGF